MNKKLLTIAIASLMAAPLTAQAVKYKLSGHVNRALAFQDDGHKTDVRNVDPVTSSSRFRIKGSEDLGNGMKAGIYMEIGQYHSRSNTANNQNNGATAAGEGDAGALVTRKVSLFYSGNWGMLTLGQYSEASDGGPRQDLSGTGLATDGLAKTDGTGQMQWWDSNLNGGAGGYSGLRGAQTWNDFNGNGQRSVLRYDSPALGPVKLAISMRNDQAYDAAAYLNTAMGGGKLAGGLYYASDSGAGNYERWGGSVSFLFSQGTSVTAAYSTQDNPGTGVPDGETFNLKLGHKWGPHAVSIGYTESDDARAGYEDTRWAAEYVHKLKKANAELYAGYQHAELDGPAGTNFEDQNILLIGSRIKFD